MSVIRHIDDEATIPYAEVTVYHSLSRHPGTNTISDYFLHVILTP